MKEKPAKVHQISGETACAHELFNRHSGNKHDDDDDDCVCVAAEDMQGKTEEEIEMMKLMGFGSFDTTKVRGNRALCKS